MHEMLPATLVERNAVAELLGLNDWRSGVHRFSDASDMWIACLWWVDVQPSFDVPWIIAGATTREIGEAPVYKRRAILIRQHASHVVECRDAAIEGAINAVPLVALSSTLSLDGISYEVYTKTMVARSHFHFSNPEIKEWVALEQALFTLGDDIAADSGLTELVEIMDTWHKYTGLHLSSRTKRST